MYAWALLLLPGAIASLQPLPPANSVSPGPGVGFSPDGDSPTVYITDSLASRRDTGGLTLIPPSGLEFAQTFVDDLKEASGSEWTLKVGQAPPPANATGIIVLEELESDGPEYTYQNGESTEEAYELEIGHGRAVIRGTGARGMWWGTRTLLQQLIIANWSTTLPAARITDAPAYATRGFMLDAGRKWYAPSFLKELCTYASFFKMSEFQYHTSDNYPLNRGHNDTWDEVYAQFSLRPESEDLQGLVQRENQTLTRADFEDLQQHCAARGITVVPEIEAPGHCLFLTKWKPELALAKKDLLNLTHPESIPTVKRIWEEFLPWFQSKEVHIGADEYDATLADDYISFVNTMSTFIHETSGKRVRIWGTEEPSQNLTIDDAVIIQHWQYGQSDPVQLLTDGYEMINSEDWWAYMSIKNDHMPILPAPYPQFFNETRVMDFGDVTGWQWEPSLFNPFNLTEQVPPTAKENKGAILAAWNDNGPDASTQLEAYYAMRRGIPLVAARAWSGKRGPSVKREKKQDSIAFLSTRAPGQNLDRRLDTIKPNHAGELLSWSRKNRADDKTVQLGYGSKGMDYTLSLTATGPFTLSSPDVTLSLSASGVLAFNADGYEYPLRSVSEKDGFDIGLPGRIWANETTSSHELVPIPSPADITITGDMIGGSRVWINGIFKGRFEVFVFGGKNTLFSWSQMAFVAPLDTLEGGVQKLVLKDGIHPPKKGCKSSKVAV
ncbi:glycoside hydrolase family 20 protein [Poronia punctata]|nr:glycoside hydrolase family 20 protein [Poronia punctata]